MVYIGTFCPYCTYLLFYPLAHSDCDIISFNYQVIQKDNRRWTVMGALTALFGVTVTQLGLQWQLLQIDFVDNGDTRDSIYDAYIFDDSTSALLSLILSYCANILADGIVASCNLQIVTFY